MYIYIEAVFRGDEKDQQNILDLIQHSICDGEHPEQECPMIHLYSTCRESEDEVMEQLVYREDE